MQFNDFEVDVILNGAAFEGPPGSFQFSISDSIHDLLPKGMLAFPDFTAYFKEGGMLADGFPVGLTLGLPSQSQQIFCNFVSSLAETGDPMTPGFMSGTINMRLRHAAAAKLSALQKAYHETLDKVILDTVSPLGFTSTSDVIAPDGTGWWYRYGLTEEDFLIDIVRPNLYSAKAAGTPFYIFVDGAGALHVKSLADLMTGSSVATIKIGPNSAPGQNGSGAQYAYDARPYSEGLDRLRPATYLDERYYGESDLSFTKTADSSFKHAAGKGNGIPLVVQGTPTDLFYLRRLRADSDQKKFMLGRIADRTRDSVIAERVLVTVFFQPLALAGTLVYLDATIPDLDSGQNRQSNYYTGQWLVERSNHSWMADRKRGISQLVLARSKVNYSSDLLLKSVVVSA